MTLLNRHLRWFRFPLEYFTGLGNREGFRRPLVVFIEFGFVLFDVTDETSISHFFAPRYRIFLFKEYGVSAVYLVAGTLCKSSELVGKGFSPTLFFVALHEVAVLLGLTGNRVSDGVCFCDCDIIFRIGVL